MSKILSNNDIIQQAQTQQKKRKRTRKEKIKITKEIDMISFKRKINDEISIAPSLDISSCIQYSKSSSPIDIYNENYKKYISEEFNTNCIVFINRLISESQTLPLNIKNKHNVHRSILTVVKELMMNEYEIAIYSLMLDNVGWSKEDYEFEDNLFYIGLHVKQYTLNNDFKYLLDYYCMIKDKIDKKYEKWKKDCVPNKNTLINFNNVNIRFRLLKKPYNVYCKTNYVDYNCVVDKILKMSLPYTETKLREDDLYEEGEEYIDKQEGNNNNEIKQNLLNKINELKHVNNNILNGEIQGNSTNYNNYNQSLFKDISFHNNNNKNENYNNLTYDKISGNAHSSQNINNDLYINNNKTKGIYQSQRNDYLQKKHNISNNQFNLCLKTQKIPINQQQVQFNLTQTTKPNQHFQNTQKTFFSGLGVYRTENQNSKYNNYQQSPSQQTLFPQTNQSNLANETSLNNLERLSVQTIDSGIFQEDELNHIFYQSNPKFFKSSMSLKDSVYNNDLDPFNLKSSTTMLKQFGQISSTNINNYKPTVNSDESSNTNVPKFNIDTALMSTSSQQQPTSNDNKKNLIGIYNSLKQQHEQN